MRLPVSPPKKLNNYRFTRNFLAVAGFCLLFLPLSVFAKTLPEYRQSLKSAGAATNQLIDYVDAVLDDGQVKNAAYERAALAEIRKSLPVTEKVEWEGNSVETGNQWLEAKLKTFEEESKDETKRRLILTDISERLWALEDKIGELENPAAAAVRSKDEDKRKLAEILRRAEYQKPPEQAESWFQKMMKKIEAWFNEKFPRPDLPEGAAEGVQSVSYALQIFLYILIFAFIGFLIYRFAPFLADKFRRREKQEKGERVILGEKLAADEDAQSLFSEAEEMARGGNLRGAIRKGYIALLCELSDRKIIGLAQHKTNRDYLRDVRKKRELHQNMNGLTTSFERHWYGFDAASESDWDEFKQTYQKAVSNEN